MSQLDIQIPESTEMFIHEQVLTGKFASPSEYVVDLVEQDRRRAARKELEGLLLEGLQSGPGIEVTPEYWEAKKQAFLARHQGKPDS
jgi:antitoxin ParD1/3/4